MPKIDLSTAPRRSGSGYPEPFDAPCLKRSRIRLGDAVGLTQFGVNLLRLPPGQWSAQRHWHHREDELVWVVSGEVVLIEDGGETVLGPGDAAGFKAGVSDGHHLVNRGAVDAVLIEVGARIPGEVCEYPDVDLRWDEADGRFQHADGTPYPPKAKR